MGKKAILQKKRLAAIFASFAILSVGTLSLSQSMSIDYYSVLNTLEKVFPACITLGGIGWVMGMILDKPKKRQLVSPPNMNNLFLNDVITNDLYETAGMDATGLEPSLELNE